MRTKNIAGAIFYCGYINPALISRWLAVDCSFVAPVYGGRRCILDAMHNNRRPSTSFILL